MSITKLQTCRPLNVRNTRRQVQEQLGSTPRTLRRPNKCALFGCTQQFSVPELVEQTRNFIRTVLEDYLELEVRSGTKIKPEV